jgi:hypothetical protein
MAFLLATEVVKIGIFDQLNQAYWLVSFTTKNQGFGGRQKNVYAKGNVSRGASRFYPVPYFVQHVYK